MVMILIAPALLVIALLLIWQGARGVLQFGEPHCRRCGYDLRGLDWKNEQRICTECGADVSQPGTVRYADYRRSPRRIVVGVVLVGLCVLGFVGEQFYRAYRYRMPSVQSNSRLIANLKTSANSPWDWQELEKRYNAGSLSGSEASAAIEQLIAYLKATPSAASGPLHWADRFFTLALKGGHISDDQLKRLCDAFYGTSPTVDMQKRVRQGGKIRIALRHTNHWDLPGVQGVQALRRVQIAGKDVQVVPRWTDTKSKDYLSCGKHGEIEGEVQVDASAGKHETVFEIDWGLLDEKTPINPRFDGRPGQAERWPRTLVRRSLTVKVPIEVVPADVSPVELVTDPTLDPQSRGVISFASIQVVPQGKRLSLRPQYQVGQITVPLCFRIKMKVADKQYDLGWAGYYQGGSTSSAGGQIESLPADVRQVVVVLEPAPDVAEEHMSVEEIWGKPIVIERVSLDRYDLEEQATMEGETKPASR